MNFEQLIMNILKALMGQANLGQKPQEAPPIGGPQVPVGISDPAAYASMEGSQGIQSPNPALDPINYAAGGLGKLLGAQIPAGAGSGGGSLFGGGGSSPMNQSDLANLLTTILNTNMPK